MTYVSLRLITLPPDRIAECAAIAAQLGQAVAGLIASSSSWVAPILEGAAINAGHIVWRLESSSEDAALVVERDPVWLRDVQPLLEDVQVTTIGYHLTRAPVRTAGAGIWRALIFRVLPEGFPTAAAALESHLLLMPKYIPAIRSWALSPVTSSSGSQPFTHVWEQEFDDLTGLTEDYMVHPLHWGLVDAWFDAECPNYMVDPRLIQVVGRIDRTLIIPPASDTN